MSPDVSDPITDLLLQLGAPGSFASRVSAPAEDLEIAVDGVGRLSFPITRSSARSLRSVARPAPFGLRDRTLHDPTVRNTWEIAASRVKIAAGWKSALAAHLRWLQAQLGLPPERELRAVLDKLLLYEPGQFFAAHQDSQKDDAMVATLVVLLPSEYRGGTLCVEQCGEKKRFARVRSQSWQLSLVAFYADCHHSIQSVSSGVRVALTYRLLLAGRGEDRPLAPAGLVDRLTDAVREHFAASAAPERRDRRGVPQRLVYLLDHEYTQRSLAWDRLKNGDRLRVAALRTAAERLA